MPHRTRQIAAIGAARATPRLEEAARRVGVGIAEAGATLLTGGGTGVMHAAFLGARGAGGRTVAIRPDLRETAGEIDPYDVALFTGLGQARNALIVQSADAAIAVGGEWGTLSEIALGRKAGTPIVLLESWTIERPGGGAPPELLVARTPEEAVELALAAATDRSDFTDSISPEEAP